MVCYLIVQDEREVLHSSSEATSVVSAATAATHGIEVSTEFKSVERPTEALDNDQPIQCPLPEPSVINVSLTSFNPYNLNSKSRSI